jgi:hypothetical protein
MAAAMVAGGMPPGAALVFLMAGPASNMATMGAIYKGFGLRNLGIYLGTLIVGSMGLALAFEELIDPVSVQTVLASAGMVGEGSHAHGDPAVWWEFGSALILCGMLLFFAFEDSKRFLRRRRLEHTAGSQEAIQFAVGGMTCGGCTGRVEKTLLAMEGVDSVIVELEPGQATITGVVSEARLKEAVASLGFSVDNRDAKKPAI